MILQKVAFLDSFGLRTVFTLGWIWQLAFALVFSLDWILTVSCQYLGFATGIGLYSSFNGISDFVWLFCRIGFGGSFWIVGLKQFLIGYWIQKGLSGLDGL